MRFMREAWVLLSWTAGDVICWDDGVDRAGGALIFGAGGGKEFVGGAATDAGDRQRWEEWSGLIWLEGAALPSSGGGGGDVTSEAVWSWGAGERKGGG